MILLCFFRITRINSLHSLLCHYITPKLLYPPAKKLLHLSKNLDPTLEKETRGWLNVAKLTGGDGFLAGLTTDGRVLLAGNRQKVADAAQWTDIVDIACGYDFCAGVTKDGRLLFAGDVHFDHH